MTLDFTNGSPAHVASVQTLIETGRAVFNPQANAPLNPWISYIRTIPL